MILAIICAIPFAFIGLLVLAICVSTTKGIR